MDWSTELAKSGWWLLKTYVICWIVLVPVCYGLVRGTVWGRQFWQLAGDYLAPRRGGWRPLAYLAFIILLTLAGVRLDVLFASWSNGMYTALQKLDAQGFWFSMAVFAVLAAIHVVRILVNYYFKERLSIHWRTALNQKLTGAWLEGQAYYRSLFLTDATDNPDQRIQQDVTDFVSSSLSLAMDTISAVVSIFAFTIMLWGLSGPLHVAGHEIPRAMVFLAYIYVIIATVFAFRIGRPLVRLNFMAEKLAADYRYALIRLREYAENIAFYRGEKVEGRVLEQRFALVIANVWQIIYRSIKFQGFNLAISQTAVVFPFLIQASRLFSKQIMLGDLMQTARAFGSLQDNLSYFRSAYDSFAGYRATLNRLSGFTGTIEAAHALPRPQIRTQVSGVGLDRLSVQAPDGRMLVEDLSLELQTGEALLVQGPSGTGKTTLLRALAGLWPHCRGSVALPAQGVMFLSQRPYLPQGSLREALCYPSPVDDEGNIAGILAEVQLAHLVPRLDEVADWSRILSLGEQQRLAFGRLLWSRPEVAFLDEASSALDEGLEFSMYRLLREQLPACIVISVGHRSTLGVHHTRRLEFDGKGGWQVQPLSGGLSSPIST